MLPFSTDKRDVTYKSSITRDPLAQPKDKQNAPGPGSYDPRPAKTQILKGKTNLAFGSNAKRDAIILRDVSKNPFVDPTCRKSPSPQKYQNNDEKLTVQNNILGKQQISPSHE